MALWENFKKIFKKRRSGEPELLPDDKTVEASFLADSRKQLQLFDEHATVAEAKIEQLSEEIDRYEQEDLLSQETLKSCPSNSWLEKNLLLKIERGRVHTENLKRQVEIYNQNIRVYLNLMSKIEEMQAMRLGGLSEDKIQNIWLDFKEKAEQYQNLLHTDEASREPQSFLTEKLVSDLNTLKSPSEPIARKRERAEIDDLLELEQELE